MALEQSSSDQGGTTGMEVHSDAPDTRAPAAKMKYPKRRYTKHSAKEQAKEFADRALDSVFTLQLFQMDTPLVKKVKLLTGNIKAKRCNAELELFFEKTTGKLWKKAVSEVRGKSWTEDTRCKMWATFHSFRCSEKLGKNWTKALDSSNISRDDETEAFVLQHIVESIFSFLLKAMMDIDMPPQPVITVPSSLDEREEQALRYCVGYVPVKLCRRFNKIKTNNTAKLYVEVLSGWAQNDEDNDADSIYTYTAEWIQKQNRGGLFKINDNVFLFFKVVEGVIQSSLNTTNIESLKHVNLQEMLCFKLIENSEIQEKWSKLCSCLPSESANKLFEEVIKCFIKMRSEAFVRVYLMILKDRNEKASRTGEKALRKELQKQK